MSVPVPGLVVHLSAQCNVCKAILGINVGLLHDDDGYLVDDSSVREVLTGLGWKQIILRGGGGVGWSCGQACFEEHHR